MLSQLGYKVLFSDRVRWSSDHHNHRRRAGQSLEVIAFCNGKRFCNIARAYKSASLRMNQTAWGTVRRASTIRQCPLASGVERN
jgi:hypothetical protein